MKYNFWYLFRPWHLAPSCQNTFWASKHCPAEFSSQNCVQTLGLNIVFQLLEKNRSTLSGIHFFGAHLESRVFAAILGGTRIGPFQHSWKFRLEISIPSTIKHETNRFVDEFHDHKNEFRWSEELLSQFKKSGVNLLHVDIATRKLVQTISAILTVILCSRRLSFLRMKESGSLLTPTVHTEEICRYKSPTWLQRWYVITIKTNENKTDQISGTHWSVLLKAFARHAAETFSDNDWIHLFHEGSSKRRVEYCEDHKNSLYYFRTIQGHSSGIPMVPELMGCTSIPYDWKEYIFHRCCSWDLQSTLGSACARRLHLQSSFRERIE